MSDTKPFWLTKTLQEMDAGEWESLCDGCGRCCLQKIQGEHDDVVHYTRVACRLLDSQTCRCTKYQQRKKLVPACIELSSENIHDFSWLPKSCAYVRIREGRGLADWHPLVSGDPDSVHHAGISVSGLAVSETYVHPGDFPSFVINFVTD